jgi:hypothetical protein
LKKFLSKVASSAESQINTSYSYGKVWHSQIASLALGLDSVGGKLL